MVGHWHPDSPLSRCWASSPEEHRYQRGPRRLRAHDGALDPVHRRKLNRGAGLPIACGIAEANRFQKNGQVVVVSLGDGAFNQGATHEGLAWAAVRNLPVIVICENNGWAEMTPTAEITRLAELLSGPPDTAS